MSEPTTKRVAYIIAAVAGTLAFIHLVRPQWAIDKVTLLLLLAAVLPWLSPIFRKVKALGIEVEFRDLQREVKDQKQKTGQLETSLTQVNQEVKQVAARDEFRTELTVQLQKLLFLVSQHQIEIERYLRDEALLRGLISEATVRFPSEALRIKSATPDPSARATYEDLLKAAEKSQTTAEEILALISDPRLTAVTPDLKTHIVKQIENTEKSLKNVRTLREYTEKVIKTWQGVLAGSPA